MLIQFKDLQFSPLSWEYEGVDGGIDMFVTPNNYVVTVKYELGETSAEGMSLGVGPNYHITFQTYDEGLKSLQPCAAPQGGTGYWCPNKTDVDTALKAIQEFRVAPAIPDGVLRENGLLHMAGKKAPQPASTSLEA